MISIEQHGVVQYHNLDLVEEPQHAQWQDSITGGSSHSCQRDQAVSENNQPITEQVISCGFYQDHILDNVELNEIERGCQSSEYPDVDEVLVASFKQLLHLYSMYSSVGGASSPEGCHRPPDSPRLVVSGGLQQYLIRHYAPQPVRGHGSLTTTFHDLPDSMQLEIFSYLDVRTLCLVSGVCRHWNIASSDEVLWKHMLERDVMKWPVIGHMTNPFMYQDCQSDLIMKEIYLRCSPEVNSLVHQQSLGFHTLSSMLRSLWPKRTVKLAMFGPGLESSTSSITRKVLEDTTGMFKVVGMFPGQFEGVGSGFTMKMNNSVQFNLVTLYTNNRKEREAATGLNRLQRNKLLIPKESDHDEEGSPVVEYEPTEGVKQLCRTLDACVFVVDASVDPDGQESVASACGELQAMINSQWMEASVPLLVLSCVPNTDTTRHPCIDIVRQLDLKQLSRPWQVHDCVVDGLQNVCTALQWVIENARRR